MTCSYDYLTEDWNHKSYVLYAFILNYALPMVIVIFFYSQIVKAVISHETALKAQAKKMNVTSLRSNAQQNESSAEVRICKVGLTLAGIYLLAWTPYAMISLVAAFGNRLVLLTSNKIKILFIKLRLE